MSSVGTAMRGNGSRWSASTIRRGAVVRLWGNVCGHFVQERQELGRRIAAEPRWKGACRIERLGRDGQRPIGG